MDLSYWQKFEKRQQILMIGSELLRAKEWQDKDKKNFLFALEQAINLLDLTVSDKRWKNYLQSLLGLRDELANIYVGGKTKIEVLYQSL